MSTHRLSEAQILEALPLTRDDFQGYVGGWEPAVLLNALADNVWALARFLRFLSTVCACWWAWCDLLSVARSVAFFFSRQGMALTHRYGNVSGWPGWLWGVASTLDLLCGIRWSEVSVGLHLRSHLCLISSLASCTPISVLWETFPTRTFAHESLSPILLQGSLD